MTETVGGNLIRKSPEVPRSKEKLSDEEMGNLLSSVGNHEAKAITLILMRGGNIFSRGNLDSVVLNAQGEKKGWRMGKKVPFSYCVLSLAPIGLVAKETLNKDLSTYGYSITEDGKELGIPLAGLLLDFSEKHSVPLNLLFGSTASTSKSKTIQTKEDGDIEFKKRSPSTTLRIIYGLLNSPDLPLRVADLAEGIASMLPRSSHVIRLSELGLIQYNTIEVNEPYSGYKLTTAIPKGELPIYKEYRKLTKEVFHVLKNHPDQYLTGEDIYNLLPKEQKEKWKSKKTLSGVISVILSFLAGHKYADVKKFKYMKKSEINVTDEQRIVLAELLEIMDRFQNRDQEILERGRNLAGEIISNPERVSNLLRRAREVSSNAGQSSPEETQGYILYAVSLYPGITNKEIRGFLEEQYGKKLSVERIGQLSTSLIKQKSIRAGKKGNLIRYYPNNEK